jgi:hypothetical protein
MATKTKQSERRVGFEAEIMFSASGYPELVEAAERRNFDWDDDHEAPGLYAAHHRHRPPRAAGPRSFSAFAITVSVVVPPMRNSAMIEAMSAARPSASSRRS